MSQHEIAMVSPSMGRVKVIAGFDPVLREFFVNALSESLDDGYVSPSGLAFEQLPALAQSEVQVKLPEALLVELRKDFDDFVAGARDVGRRFYRYADTGELVTRTVW